MGTYFFQNSKWGAHTSAGGGGARAHAPPRSYTTAPQGDYMNDIGPVTRGNM